jgi:hypothetical protein
MGDDDLDLLHVGHYRDGPNKDLLFTKPASARPRPDEEDARRRHCFHLTPVSGRISGMQPSFRMDQR